MSKRGSSNLMRPGTLANPLHRYVDMVLDSAEPDEVTMRLQSVVKLQAMLAFRFVDRGLMNEDEAVSRIVDAFLHADKQFDSSFGVKYSSFVAKTTRWFLIAPRLRQTVVRVPDSIWADIALVKKAREEFREEVGRYPTVDELSERMDRRFSSVQNIVGAMKFARNGHMPAISEHERGGDVNAEFAPSAPDDVFREASKSLDMATAKESIERMLGRISEKKAAVIRAVFFQGRTLRDIAKDHGCTHQNASLIFKRAVKDLREIAPAWLEEAVV